MSYTRFAALALCVAALVASGCGGSSKSSTQPASSTASQVSTQSEPTSANTLSRAELVAKANAICAAVNAKLNSVNIKETSQYARLLPAIAAYERAQFVAMGKLTPPPSMATTWKVIATNAQIDAENLVKIGEYAKANNLAAAQSGPEVAFHSAQQKFASASKQAGIKECFEVTQ